MIIGYKKIKHVEPGSLIRTKHGSYAVISEYNTSSAKHFDGFLLETGEALHCDPDEWVAIIDLDVIETEIQEDLEYPDA